MVIARFSLTYKSDVEKDKKMMLMRLNPVATLLGTLQMRKNEISLRSWSGGIAHLRGKIVYGSGSQPGRNSSTGGNFMNSGKEFLLYYS